MFSLSNCNSTTLSSWIFFFVQTLKAATFMMPRLLPDMIGCLCFEAETYRCTALPLLAHSGFMRLQHCDGRLKDISSTWRQSPVPLREPQNHVLSQSGPGTDVIESAEFIPQGAGWHRAGCYMLAVLISLAGRNSRKDVATFELELGGLKSSFKSNAAGHPSPASLQKLFAFQSWLGPWVLLYVSALLLHAHLNLHMPSDATQIQNTEGNAWIVFLCQSTHKIGWNAECSHTITCHVLCLCP
jgi:hypothetical protein